MSRSPPASGGTRISQPAADRRFRPSDAAQPPRGKLVGDDLRAPDRSRVMVRRHHRHIAHVAHLEALYRCGNATRSR